MQITPSLYFVQTDYARVRDRWLLGLSVLTVLRHSQIVDVTFKVELP
jgi:hypothetical protein